MAWYEVRGGRPLDGAVKIQGSKNGALPVLAGALLHRGRTVLHNCPGITDVGYTLEILRSLGCSVTVEKDALILDAAGLDRNRVPESLGEKMRSSVILLGSLLGRFREACLPYPGGCTIGKRPIDLHLKMLSEMGVTFTEEERGLKASCRRLSGAEFSLPFPSVGATENVILAAVLAEGVTVLSGAASRRFQNSAVSFGEKERGSKGTGRRRSGSRAFPAWRTANLFFHRTGLWRGLIFSEECSPEAGYSWKERKPGRLQRS